MVFRSSRSTRTSISPRGYVCRPTRGWWTPQRAWTPCWRTWALRTSRTRWLVSWPDGAKAARKNVISILFITIIIVIVIIIVIIIVIFIVIILLLLLFLLLSLLLLLLLLLLVVVVSSLLLLQLHSCRGYIPILVAWIPIEVGSTSWVQNPGWSDDGMHGAPGQKLGLFRTHAWHVGLS